MKDAKLKIAILAPIVLGIALLFIGIATGIPGLTYAGIGVLFGGSFLVAIIMTILTLVGVGRDNSPASSTVDTPKDEEPSDAAADDGDETEHEHGNDEAEHEQEMIEAVNSSYGYESQAREAEHTIEHIRRARRHGTDGDKVKSVIFVCFLLIDFILIPIFAVIGIYIGAIICFALFALTIIGALIVTKIMEHVSMSTKKVDTSKYDRKTAIVVTSVMSSSTSTGGRRTTRITGMTYRIILDVEGKQYNAYSKRFYGSGDRVAVWVKKNGKTVKIIEDETPPSVGGYSALTADYNRRNGIAETDEDAEELAQARQALATALDAAAQSREDNGGTDSADEPVKQTAEPQKPADEEIRETAIETRETIAAEKAEDPAPKSEEIGMGGVANDNVDRSASQTSSEDETSAPITKSAAIGYKGIKKK